jgi:flagellar hook-length control protein FliK
MTSIATYLASLTGAAPQEGQNAVLASAMGGVGLFAALLQSSDATQGIEGETALPLDTNGLPVTAPSSQVTNHVTNDDAVEGAVLREALTDGLELPQDGAEIDAAIIEAPSTDETAQSSPQQPAAQKEIENPNPQTAQPVEQPVLDEASEVTPVAAPIVQDENAPLEAQPQRQNQNPGEASARSAVLENILVRTPQTGKANGLQTALNQTVQARGVGETGLARGVGETGQPVTATSEKPADPSPGPAPVATDDTPDVKSAQARPETAPKATEIIQRLVKSADGQSIIQIQERPVGEPAGVSSPPTLTVSVQAPVASPGPASATPHVPVSALAVHIASQASNGVKRFDIRLDPPELGRIEVRLDVTREGRVTTHLVVERAETLDLLQRDARQLERALQNAGLDISEEDMKFSLKDQDLAHGENDRLNAEDDKGANAGSDEDSDPSLNPDDAMPPPTRYMATSGLDIRI